MKSCTDDDESRHVVIGHADVTCRRRGRHHIVTVVGELGCDEAPHLHGLLTGVFAEGDGDVIVDMTAVDFLDPTSLGALIAAQGRLHDRSDSRVLHVVAGDGGVRRILSITGMTSAFFLHKDEATALGWADTDVLPGRRRPRRPSGSTCQPIAHEDGPTTPNPPPVVPRDPPRRPR